MTSKNSNDGALIKLTPEKIMNRKKAFGCCKSDGVPVDIDLADDAQFEYLIDERGGDAYLQKYFPHYHRSLHESRAKAINAKKTNAIVAPKQLTLLEKVANGEDVSSDWHDMIQITSLIAQQDQNVSTKNSVSFGVQAIALVSYVNGMQTLNATLTIANTNTGQLIAQTNISQIFDQANDAVIFATGSTSTLDGIEASLTVDGLPYQTGEPVHKVVLLALQDTIDPSSNIVVTNPVHKAKKPNVGFMKVCLGRSADDCDYLYDYQPAGGIPTPKIAVSGSVTYTGTILPPSPDSNKFGVYFFINKHDLRATQLFANLTDAYKYFTLTDNHTLSWNFDPASFEKSNVPWNQGETVDLNLTVAISVDSQVKNTQFQVTSLTAAKESMSVAKIDVLKFVWGCLAADSMIRMKDGSLKRIDSILVGQKVQTDDFGSWLLVTDVVNGVEKKPCIKITTNKGRSLIMTDSHPVGLLDGFLLAKELRIGNLIKTETGVETISSIQEEIYEGTVYNLKLETPENMPASGAAHFANGILVGDGNMQGILSEKWKNEKSRKPLTIDEIPAEWRFDAKNTRRLKEGLPLIPAEL